jgi:amidase
VLRPAAFCGVVGYKPSHGKIPTTGVHPLAPTLDHVGFFATHVADAALAHALFIDCTPDAIASTMQWNSYFADGAARKPTRIAVVRTPLWDRVSPEQQANFETALKRLRDAGVTLVDPHAFDDMPRVLEAVQTLLAVEAAAAVGPAADKANPDLVSHHMHALIAEGKAVPDTQYQAALALRDTLRAGFHGYLNGCDAIVTVAATGEAPEGLNSTGDPSFCAPWSFLGVPAVVVPSGKAASGMPLGLQIIGDVGEDLVTLQTAAWIENIVR